MNWKFWQKQPVSTEPVKVFPIVIPDAPMVVNPLEGATIENGKEDQPKFSRTYTKQLSAVAEIKLDFTTSNYWGRKASGTLTQPNYNYIFFDPHRIADKILDPKLVPLVEAFCLAAILEDARWIKENANEYTDETGQRWVKAA
ncbi:hypothetical protein D3C87_666230 [compost metagenome]